jgi:hypothetical protein
MRAIESPSLQIRRDIKDESSLNEKLEVEGLGSVA